MEDRSARPDRINVGGMEVGLGGPDGPTGVQRPSAVRDPGAAPVVRGSRSDPAAGHDHDDGGDGDGYPAAGLSGSGGVLDGSASSVLRIAWGDPAARSDGGTIFWGSRYAADDLYRRILDTVEPSARPDGHHGPSSLPVEHHVDSARHHLDSALDVIYDGTYNGYGTADSSDHGALRKHLGAARSDIDDALALLDGRHVIDVTDRPAAGPVARESGCGGASTDG